MHLTFQHQHVQWFHFNVVIFLSVYPLLLSNNLITQSWSHKQTRCYGTRTPAYISSLPKLSPPPMFQLTCTIIAHGLCFSRMVVQYYAIYSSSFCGSFSFNECPQLIKYTIMVHKITLYLKNYFGQFVIILRNMNQFPSLYFETFKKDYFN